MPDYEATRSLSGVLFGAGEQRSISRSCALLLQAAPSFLSHLAQTWKEKQSALCWVEGNVLFNSKGIFLSFFNSISLENLEQCHFNFAKPHVGREMGTGRLVENAAAQLWLPRCAHRPGLRLVCAIGCRTGSGSRAASPAPTNPSSVLTVQGTLPWAGDRLFVPEHNLVPWLWFV